jgi:hypothetical protein
MGLKPLKLEVAAAPSAKKSDVPARTLAGVAIAEFIRLKAEVEDRAARMKTLEEEIKLAGCTEVISINCENATNPVSSVRLQDDEGAKATVSFTSKYSDIDADAFSAVFAEINARRKAARLPAVSEAEYAQFVIAAKLNDVAFYDKDGNFQEAVYAEVRKALDAVAAKLVAAGKVAAGTPLYTEAQKARVKPTFHAKRWELGVEDNTSLLGTVRNTVTLKPVAGTVAA